MQPRKRPCPNCGSSNINNGIVVGISNEVNRFGLKYAPNFLFRKVTQMYCDLCNDCGEVVRFYIKDKTDKKWVK